jgi:acylphosphatase
MIKRAHLEVFGRVQGVYFRQETMEQAITHGVNGWVRNNRDGNVEAIFEGEEQAVRKMVKWCGRGPASARVERVEVSWEEPSGEFDRFYIERSGW